MYAVAGHVIERVTGQAWEEAVKARIFKPLEMHHSNFSLQKSDSWNEFSQDYFYLDQEALFIPVPFHNITLIGPAIGINSSVSDMLKWVQLQLSDGPLLDKIHSKKTILQEMHTPQIVALDSSLPPSALFNYGLGWRMGCYRDNTLVMHAGTRDGFQAQIALLPSEKIGVVILTNGALISNHRVSREKYFVSAISNIILDALLGCEKVNWTQKMAEIYEQTKLSVSVQSQEDTKQLIAISPVLHDYIGTYQHHGYGTLQIELKNNYLQVTYGDITSALICKNEDLFMGHEYVFAGKKFVFTRNPLGKIQELQISLEPSVKPIVFRRD
jgi:hypothetical protein